MKKMFLLLLVALLGSQMIFAQVRSCVTYDSKRDLNGFKQVILTWKDPFIRKELWPAYVSLVNESLKEKGMTIPVSLKGITFILENTQEYENSYFVQDDYLNGVRIGDKLEYRNVAGNPSDWAVFVYDDVVCMYSKIGCCNSQKPKFETDNKKMFLPVAEKTSPSQLTPTPTSNPVSAQSAKAEKKDTVYIVERQEVSNESERPERSEGNTYYINNTTPYGYYGMGYYYGYYGGNYCYRYYGGLAHHYNYYGNYYHNGYTGNYNHYTGSNYNYTGGYNHSTGNYNYTGRNNRSTNYGAGYTGRRGGNTTTTTNRGTMTPGRGYQNTSGTGGGRSNISPSYNSRNQTPTNVGRSTNSFSSRASTFRSSGSTGGGQRGRR